MSQAEGAAEYPWERAQETFNSFKSDDSEDEMPRTPASRQPRVRGSQGSGARGGRRKAGSEVGAGSTAAASAGGSSAGNGGGSNSSSSSSSSSSRDDSLRASEREAQDGGTEEGEREAGRDGDDREKREGDNDDSSSTTTAGTSALPAGDTDLEDDNRAAARKATDTGSRDPEEKQATPSEKEKVGGSSSSGVAGGSSSEQARAETAVESCPMCSEEFPVAELNAHIQRCVDEYDDVQVVDAPGAAAAAQGGGGGASGASPPQGAAGSSSGSSEGQGAAGSGSGSSEGQGAAGSGSGAGEQKCFVCDKPFPAESMQSHVNLCLDKQVKAEEEREKKERRAKRQSMSLKSLKSRRYVPTETRAQGPRVKNEDTKADIKPKPSAAAATAAAPAPAGDSTAVDNGAPPERSPGKPSDSVEPKNNGGGKGAGRGGGAAGKRKKGPGSDRARPQQKEKAQDKPEGKGKGRLLPPGASGRWFKCPKKPRGCGAINTESSQRCCKCNLRLWTLVKVNGGTAPPVRFRVDDLVRWWEHPYMAVPGKDEKKQQVGYVYSLEDHNDEGGDVEAFCTYRHQPGYLSAAINLKDLELVAIPPPEKAGNKSAGSGAGGDSGGGGGGGGSSDGGAGNPGSGGSGSGGGGGGSSSTGSGSGGGSSVSSLSTGGSRPSVTVQSWGSGKCEHVETGSEVNYKNGKCHPCHEARKSGGGISSDPMEAEEQKEEETRVEDKSVKCESPGCDNGQYALGVCCPCFDRHRKRIAEIRTAAKKKRQLQEKDPPPCRACEGLLSETQHADCVRSANGNSYGDENASVDSLDNSVTGKCSKCGIVGGQGRDNQLLLCDGNFCPNATHMKCLDPPLNEVPRWLWYCDACVLDKNAEVSERGCNACGSADDDEKILYCDGPGCNSTPYHYDCLPVPLEGIPLGTDPWLCPRCAHGQKPSSVPSSSVPVPVSGGKDGGGGSGSGGGGGSGSGGGGGGGGGRSTGRQGQNGPTGTQARSRGRGGQSGKRKRGGGFSNGGSGGGGGGASSRKRSAHATSATVSPPPDLCDHHACLLGSGTGTGTATVSRGGGSAAECGGGLEVLARKEAEHRRWRCKSDKCRGNSYHMMCLETTRAGGEPPKGAAAGRDTRSEGGGDDVDSGTEMLGTTAALATERLAGEAEDGDDSSGSEGNGGLPPASGVSEKSGVVLEVGGEADVVVGKRLTAITTAVAVAASMTGMKVVAVAGASLPVVAEAAAATGVAAMDVVPVIGLAAAAAAAAAAPAPAPEEEELWGWKSDLLCPECGGVIATQEEAALAQQRILRYRIFKAALSRSFFFEFGKERSAVEDDRGLGIKGSVYVRGHSAHMYGSICAGAADFIFRTCGLTSHDCFLDIGSGLGQIVTQAAAWAGCRSLGVEVVGERHQAAVRLYNMVKRETAGTVLDVSALAQVTLIEGDFVDKWDEIKDCTVIYFNNERGWFKAPDGDPAKAKFSYEFKLVSLLQKLGRSVTLVTMEKMDPSPQAWTHTEHIFGKPNGDKRVATFAAGSLNFHFYKTNSGPWQCSFCKKQHATTVIECSCPSSRRADLRPKIAGSGSSSSSSSSSSSNGSSST